MNALSCIGALALVAAVALFAVFWREIARVADFNRQDYLRFRCSKIVAADRAARKDGAA